MALNDIPNVRVQITSLTTGINGDYQADGSFIKLNPSYTGVEQMSLAWSPVTVTNSSLETVTVADLGADARQAIATVPASAYAFNDRTRKFTFYPDQFAAITVEVDGEVYTRPALAPTPTNPLFISRATPVEEPVNTLSFGQKISSDDLNEGNEQMIFRIQEIASTSEALFNSEVLTGKLDDVITETFSGLIDVAAPSLTVPVTLRWDDSANAWVEHVDSMSDYTDTDTTGATTDQVLTWDGSQWVSQDQQADPLAQVNTVNGQSGEVTLGTNDLTNDSGFITTAGLPTGNSSFANDVGYITSAEAPVQSVNGSTGSTAVVLPTSIQTMTDVVVSGLTDGDALIYDGSNWTNGTPTDDVDVDILTNSPKPFSPMIYDMWMDRELFNSSEQIDGTFEASSVSVTAGPNTGAVRGRSTLKFQIDTLTKATFNPTFAMKWDQVEPGKPTNMENWINLAYDPSTAFANSDTSPGDNFSDAFGTGRDATETEIFAGYYTQNPYTQEWKPVYRQQVEIDRQPENVGVYQRYGMRPGSGGYVNEQITQSSTMTVTDDAAYYYGGYSYPTASEWNSEWRPDSNAQNVYACAIPSGVVPTYDTWVDIEDIVTGQYWIEPIVNEAVYPVASRNEFLQDNLRDSIYKNTQYISGGGSSTRSGFRSSSLTSDKQLNSTQYITKQRANNGLESTAEAYHGYVWCPDEGKHYPHEYDVDFSSSGNFYDPFITDADIDPSDPNFNQYFKWFALGLTFKPAEISTDKWVTPGQRKAHMQSVAHPGNYIDWITDGTDGTFRWIGPDASVPPRSTTSTLPAPLLTKSGKVFMIIEYTKKSDVGTLVHPEA